MNISTEEKTRARIEWVMFLAENLKVLLSASIAFVWSMLYGLSPNTYYKQKEQTRKKEILFVCSFLFVLV